MTMRGGMAGRVGRGSLSMTMRGGMAGRVGTDLVAVSATLATLAAPAAVEPALAALATAPTTGIINSTSEPRPIAVFGSLTSSLLCPPIICIVVVGNTSDAAVPATVAGVTLPLNSSSLCRSVQAANSPALLATVRAPVAMVWPALCNVLATL